MLGNRSSEATQRIDLVLTGPWIAQEAHRTGSTPFQTAQPPFWASDHFGVAAELELRR
jgi:endonuclease/exonuclease/phosphatase family metal-dependent hydrolase